MRDNIEVVKDAIELVKPSIDRLFRRTFQPQLHIVVMDPRVKPWEADFEDAILYQESIGTPAEWKAPFDQFARKKAKLAWRNSVSDISFQQMHPSALDDDDMLFYGSFVHGNTVVAASGVEPWYDMLVSGWVALAFEQLCINDYQRLKSQSPLQDLRKP